MHKQATSVFDALRDSRWAIPAIGTLAGAGIGASTGLLIGTNKILPGAGIGALFGAAAGLGTQYLLQDHQQNSRAAQNENNINHINNNLQDMARATLKLNKYPTSKWDARMLRKALTNLAGDKNGYNNSSAY